MNVRISRWALAVGAALALLVGSGGGSVAVAAPVPVKLELTELHCIKTYEVDPKVEDQAYYTVTGVAKGEELNKRVPETGATPANKKQPVVLDKPVALWEGELGDGEFALVTFTLFQGKGDDAGKAFAAKLAEAAKGVAERSKKTLTADEAKKLAADTLAAQRPVVTAVKETLGRKNNTDHFNGLFNVLLWNNNGTLVKRLDPVGLTFGEHYGDKEKIYTKIKYTLPDVNFPDPADGEWYPRQVPPIAEDKLTVYVKMLETDYGMNTRGKEVKNVTDYLAGLRVTAAGKPVEWKLGPVVIKEKLESSLIHMYWEWAE